MSVNTTNSGEARPDSGIITEEEIASQLIAERERLEQAAGLAQPRVRHFRRPEERPFTAEERSGSPSSSAGSPGSTRNLSRLFFTAAATAAKTCPIRILPPITWAGSSVIRHSAIPPISPWAI